MTAQSWVSSLWANAGRAVQSSSLSLKKDLADGDECSTHEAIGRPAAFKAYHSPADPRMRHEVLPQLIALLDQIKAQRREVDSCPVWPNGGVTANAATPSLKRAVGAVGSRPSSDEWIAAPSSGWGDVSVSHLKARTPTSGPMSERATLFEPNRPHVFQPVEPPAGP